jgi:uncharacterized membrane protein
VTIVMVVAIVVTGLFAGASMYVSVVEHPARIESGAAAAVRHFGPSARRAAVLQGSLAVAGLVAAAVAWGQGAGTGWLLGGLLLGSMVPFTLIVIMPTNRRLLDPSLDTGSSEAVELLRRWGRLHAVRTIVGVVAFVCFVSLALR